MNKQFEICRYGSSKFELIDNKAQLGHHARHVAVLEFDSAQQANDFEAYVNRLPTRAATERKNRARREKHRALTDLGLKRVRGALGGVYYE